MKKMKKLQDFANPLTDKPSVRTPVVITIAVALAVAFWFATSPNGLADPSTDCTVCHKRTLTLTLTCGSVEYRRHKDHGDPDGACPASSSRF